MRFLLPIRPGEQVDEGRLAFMLQQLARPAGSPSLSCLLRMTGTQKPRRLLLTGSATGTAVTELDGAIEPPAADLTVEAAALDLVAVLTQTIDLAAAEASGRVRIDGDRARLAELPQLFEIEASHAGTISLSARTDP
jgi:hypothetical protein